MPVTSCVPCTANLHLTMCTNNVHSIKQVKFTDTRKLKRRLNGERAPTIERQLSNFKPIHQTSHSWIFSKVNVHNLRHKRLISEVQWTPTSQFLQTILECWLCVSTETRSGQGCFLSGLDFCALLVPPTPQQTLEESDAQSSWWKPLWHVQVSDNPQFTL